MIPLGYLNLISTGLTPVAWWLGGGGRRQSPSDNFLGALKLVTGNVKYYAKYVKSGLSTNSKIVVILAFL